MGNLRDAEDYLANLWDWSFLNNCFGNTKIRVTDLDGLVERNGHYLFIETKRPSAEIPYGQRLLFDSLIKSPVNTVMIIWGQKNAPEHVMFWGHKPFVADEEAVKTLVARWFQYAEDKRFRP